MLFLSKSIFLSIIVSISVLYPGSANRQYYTKTNESYNNSEINRIVEFPIKSIEEDILDILSGKAYKHAYYK